MNIGWLPLGMVVLLVSGTACGRGDQISTSDAATLSESQKPTVLQAAALVETGVVDYTGTKQDLKSRIR